MPTRTRVPYPALAALLLLARMIPGTAEAANVVVIGDSLSAEYEAIPDFPGTENPTEYARVTVKGWEALSWVEVLVKLRGDSFNFGGYKSDLLGWADLRFSGYEFNFAIPGFEAAQYEEIVNSSLFSSPFYLPFRSALQDAIKKADRVVIWLGANEIRANYGFLAEGGNPTSLINGLIDDLTEVIAFVQKQRSNLEIVLVNLPDLGAAPSKKSAHPAPQRAVATTAIRRANDAIAQLAASKKIPLADAFSQTERLIAGEKTFFGAIEIINESNRDNDPHYHFTREGLHPNTPTQIELARVIIQTFNTAYNARIPQITDGEALRLLGIDPFEPYVNWINRYNVSQRRMEDDPDGDGLPNLVELAFGLDPSTRTRAPLFITMNSGKLKVTFFPNPSYRALVRISAESSSDLTHWTDLPTSAITSNSDGSVSANLQVQKLLDFIRLRVAVSGVD